MAKLPVTGVILAGGQGRRVGGSDKGLLPFRGQALYLTVLQRLQTQVSAMMINANRHVEIYQQSGYPIYSDGNSEFQGPLAGIYRGLVLAETDWLLFVSCDTPFLPLDLAERLWQQHQQAPAMYVTENGHDHPTFLLIHRCLAEPLKRYLDHGERKLRRFLDAQSALKVDFSDCASAFVNLNTLDELRFWEQQ